MISESSLADEARPAGPPDMLAAALAYAARGWRVFPCDARAEKPWAKRPLVAADRGEDGKPIEGTGWPKKATTDAATIREWWRRWPNALIGMAPGWAGAFVVDLDPKGESVESVEARLAEALGHALPAGPRTVTQSGGRHVWFARPEGAHFGNDTTGLKNIDIRCDAGYVILPPSRLTNGNAYAWEGAPFDGEAPALPAGLLDLIANRRQRASVMEAVPPAMSGPAPALTAHTPGEEAKRRYARVALDRIVADAAGAPQGHRGTELFAAACQLGRFITAGALSEREVLAALQDAAEANGLIREDGAARVQREIRRGLEAGRVDASDVVARLDAIAREAGERRRREWAPEPAGYPEPEPRGEVAPFPAPLSSPARPAASSSHSGGSAAAETGGAGGGGDAGEDCLHAELARLPCTDLGNAKRFLRRFGDEFLFVRDWGWLAWDGRRWSRREAERALEGRIKEAIRLIEDEADWLAASGEDPEIQKPGKRRPGNLSDELRDWAMTSQAAGHVNCLRGLVQSDRERSPDVFDADPMVINVRNGTLEVRKRPGDEPYVQLRPHRREDCITKMAEVDYDPEAACPMFDAFFAEVQPTTAVRRFLDQWGGLSLTGDIGEQKLVFFYGKGRNGKGVYVETLKYIAGSYTETVPVETFLDSGRARRGGEANPDIAILPGVRYLTTSEPEKGAKLAEGLIKLATGGDTMKARHLNRDFFSFVPQFKLTMQGNYRPKITGTDDGIWGRLLLIPWPVFIPPERRDPRLTLKLRAEASGILNRLLGGLCDWLDHGLVLPEVVIEATQQYREDSDPLGRFLTECTVSALGQRVQSTALHRVFCAWAGQADEKAWSAKGLASAMKDRGMSQTKSSNSYWLDIALIKSEHDFEPVSPSPEKDDDNPYER